MGEKTEILGDSLNAKSGTLFDVSTAARGRVIPITTALWCVLIARLLPYKAAIAAKWSFKNYDNKNPRVRQSKQDGFRTRGNAAQYNSFEAFPVFAAAVVIVTLLKASPAAANGLAVFLCRRAPPRVPM